jgi:hypothetical protein
LIDVATRICCEVYHGIRSVDPGAWGRITGGHPYTGAEWCRYGEAVLGCEGYYVVLTSGDEPVGGACFSLLHREQIPFANKTVRGLLERHLDRHPLLACRTAPPTNYSGLCLPHSPELRQPALDAIRTAAREIARSEGASFTLFDYLEDRDVDLGWDGGTPLRGFLDEGTRLDIAWDTFDDYLAHIGSASLSRRKWLKRHVKVAVEMGIQVRFDPLPADLDAVVRLHENVEQQYGEIPYPYTREVFSQVRGLPGAAWMTAYHQGRLVASELLLHDEPNHVCTPVLYGRDYETEHVYFYTYYEVVRYAIEQLHARLLVGNSGAYEFKHHLGFEPDLRNNLVFSTASPVAQTMSGWMARLAG